MQCSKLQKGNYCVDYVVKYAIIILSNRAHAQKNLGGNYEELY